jgi:hypothetical protein
LGKLGGVGKEKGGKEVGRKERERKRERERNIAGDHNKETETTIDEFTSRGGEEGRGRSQDHLFQEGHGGRRDRRNR